MKKILRVLFSTTLLFGFMACDTETTDVVASGVDAKLSSDKDSNFRDRRNRNKIPKPYRKLYNIEDIYVDGDTISITTLSLPDHTSPFYEESDPLYEEYTGDNPDFTTEIELPTGEVIDPDIIASQFILKIPRYPEELETGNEPTSIGPIGIALNGVVLFSQFNGQGDLLDDVELNNMDQWNGHPSPRLAYHYHLEPLWLTQNKGRDALLGFLLDGFPVYGVVEDGVTLASSDLDEFHGHFGHTKEYPKGTYHYHFTDDAPWLNGDGYKGTPGFFIE